jgi:hypothetical protein
MPPVQAHRRLCEWKGDTPRLPWGRVFLSALVLVVVSISGLDAHWRGQGFRPTVPETKALWYFWRHLVYRGDGKVIVLAGTSRIAAAVSLATMCEYLPDYRVVQLAIPGDGSCVGLLKDLMNDPDFRGTVICELDTPLLERSRWEGNPEFRTFRDPTMASLVDSVANDWLHDRLVCVSEPLTLRAYLATGLLREMPSHESSNTS